MSDTHNPCNLDKLVLAADVLKLLGLQDGIAIHTKGSLPCGDALACFKF